ncbi:MAG: O-antigen polymerase [Fusobacteriaceae bacterium]
MLLLLISIFIIIIIIEKSYFDLYNPIILIIMWWLGWLILSNTNTKINIENKTNLYFLFNFTVFYVSSIFFRNKILKNKIFRSNNSKILEKLYIKIEKSKIIFMIINIICVIVFIRYLANNSLSYSQYRELLFVDDEISNKIYSKILRKLLFISNLFFLFFYSKSLYCLKNNKYKNLIFYFFNLMILDFLNASRSYILIGTILIIVALRIFKFPIKKILIMAIVGGGIAILLSLGRGKIGGIGKTLKTYIYYYHTVPFALFNKEYIDGNSFLNTIQGNGKATLGLILIIFTNLLGLNGPIEFQKKILNHMLTFINIGVNEPFYYNAFYTIFYNFYLDGGVIFSLFIMLLYSYSLSYNFIKYKRESNVMNFLGVYVLLLIGVTSIYFSVTYTYYWLILFFYFIIIFLKKIIKFVCYSKKIERRKN